MEVDRQLTDRQDVIKNGTLFTNQESLYFILNSTSMILSIYIFPLLSKTTYFDCIPNFKRLFGCFYGSCFSLMQKANYK